MKEIVFSSSCSRKLLPRFLLRSGRGVANPRFFQRSEGCSLYQAPPNDFKHLVTFLILLRFEYQNENFVYRIGKRTRPSYKMLFQKFRILHYTFDQLRISALKIRISKLEKQDKVNLTRRIEQGLRIPNVFFNFQSTQNNNSKLEQRGCEIDWDSKTMYQNAMLD